jgi:hypothetical protein
MKRLVVQVMQVDEDVASQAVLNSLAAIKKINMIEFNDKKVVVEPHDDVRGIIARVDFSYVSPAAEKSKVASAALQYAIQSLIKAQLFNVTHLKVTTETGNTK